MKVLRSYTGEDQEGAIKDFKRTMVDNSNHKNILQKIGCFDMIMELNKLIKM